MAGGVGRLEPVLVPPVLPHVDSSQNLTAGAIKELFLGVDLLFGVDGITSHVGLHQLHIQLSPHHRPLSTLV